MNNLFDKADIGNLITSKDDLSSYGQIDYHQSDVNRIRNQDSAISILSLIFAIFVTAVTVLVGAEKDFLGFFPPTALLVFTLVYLKIRGGARDLVLIEGLVLVIYSLVPHLGTAGYDPLSRIYGLSGGNWIHNIAIISYFWSVPIIIHLVPAPYRPNLGNVSSTNSIATFASILTGIISIILSLMYVARFGFVVGGDTDYMDNFELKQTGAAGLGMLLLAVPLGTASLALALTTISTRINYAYIVATTSLIALFVVQGQRKYLIIPLLFFAVSKFRVKTIISLLWVILAVVVTWLLFCYLGYLRLMGLTFWDGFEGSVISSFWSVRERFLAGETTALTATASAAMQGVISPLPNWGDYLQSWQMAVPQFLSPGQYTPANERFAYAFNGRSASKGMGWGFDYWGEAYVVGGYFGIAFACVFLTGLLRFIYIRSARAGDMGFWGAFAIMGSYYALWFQRNALAYFLREYIVFGAVVLLMSLIVARTIRLAFVKKAPRLSNVQREIDHADL